eukprot:3224933-Pleurochrysis_carterae.AAC.1
MQVSGPRPQKPCTNASHNDWMPHAHAAVTCTSLDSGGRERRDEHRHGRAEDLHSAHFVMAGNLSRRAWRESWAVRFRAIFTQ